MCYYNCMNTTTTQYTGSIRHEAAHFNANAGCMIPAAYIVDVYNADDERVMSVRGRSINDAVWSATQEYPGIVIAR